jgi:hypothetical protein
MNWAWLCKFLPHKFNTSPNGDIKRCVRCKYTKWV